MNKIILSFLLILTVMPAFSQEENEIESLRKQVLNEGLLLFRLEKASWYATDKLVANHQELLPQLGGYLSYADHQQTRTIFWNKENKVALTVTFDSIATETGGNEDKTVRDPSQSENDLIALRKKGMELLTENKDRFFTFYENTNPNLIPLIRDGQRQVFILTGPKGNELLVGNDYKLTFNDQNEVTSQRKLHNSLIRLDQPGEVKNVEGTVHSHILKDQPIMTSTDICTFLLYKDMFKMKSHTVVSQKWMSMLRTDTGMLIVLDNKNFKN